MSKNRYRMPCNGTWYVEYGGYTKKTSHSWEIPSQRYAYDLEIRKNNLPYHDEPDKIENYYSYLEEICAPLDGFVITIVNEYKNTHITKHRKVINDSKDPKGNYIVIKHQNGEYSTICHFEKDSFVDVQPFESDDKTSSRFKSSEEVDSDLENIKKFFVSET